MDYIKNTYAEIYIDEGILYFKYLPFENFDIEAAKTIVTERLKLQKEVPFPVLCDIRQLTLPDIKARRYLAVEGSMLTKAVAYWTDPIGKEYLSQFFISVNQPPIPTAVFTEKRDAVEYLQSFVL